MWLFFERVTLFLPPSFCRLLPPCPSFPLGRQPCALEALRDETTDWSCCRGGEGKKRKTRKAPEKAWMALQPRHQPATKLDVVKLSNYLSNCSKTSGGEKQRGRGDFFPPIVLQNKMVFIKKTRFFIRRCRGRAIMGNIFLWFGSFLSKIFTPKCALIRWGTEELTEDFCLSLAARHAGSVCFSTAAAGWDPTLVSVELFHFYFCVSRLINSNKTTELPPKTNKQTNKHVNNSSSDFKSDGRRPFLAQVHWSSLCFCSLCFEMNTINNLSVFGGCFSVLHHMR